MERRRVEDILQAVASGRLTVPDALDAFVGFPYADLDFAQIDLHRGLRRGFPEVIFGAGKTADQILAIAERIMESGGPLLATRISPEAGRLLAERFAAGQHDPLSGTFHIGSPEPQMVGRGIILILSAGTSDLPVANEAALTARLMGNQVEQINDVGVAGLHRLLPHRERMQQAEVLVVVAGMEGALPSVVGGLVDRPVVAVPTSVGYGTSYNGLAALLGMLNSCVPGVTVVNIDNGFGAGYAAALINRRRSNKNASPSD